MALPSNTCLDKHLQGFKSIFGFNPKVFSALEQKTKDMDEFSLHGGLVFDELKLSENIAVKASGELSGFVDLGNFTELEDKTSLSDHGLIIMFQPFQAHLPNQASRAAIGLEVSKAPSELEAHEVVPENEQDAEAVLEDVSDVDVPDDGPLVDFWPLLIKALFASFAQAMLLRE
ncbi:hypothetical protein HPB49_007152 [Dermacentor silvarum]|uniref:Uncharacterized protein n=1 Tax=Dermacentor silvarum TaxID=543639 RepID=A0ACB8CJZ6_DERSI|nr:hypothetical protein HPB49_007152 [Dermacentor silvarum]